MADAPRMISYQEIQFAVDYEDGERAEGIRVIPSAVRALEAEHGSLPVLSPALHDLEEVTSTAA